MRLETAVIENLRKDGYTQPKYPSKSDFTEILIRIVDPMTKETLKEYTITLSEYNSYHYEKRYEIKPFIIEKQLKDEKYQKALVEYEKQLKIYKEKYDEYLQKELEKRNINNEKYNKLQKMKSIISDYFDMDDFTDDEMGDLEDEILKIL